MYNIDHNFIIHLRNKQLKLARSHGYSAHAVSSEPVNIFRVLTRILVQKGGKFAYSFIYFTLLT